MVLYLISVPKNKKKKISGYRGNKKGLLTHVLWQPGYLVTQITQDLALLAVEILAELIRQAPDLLANIIAEKGGLDKINSIAKGELTSTDSEAFYINMKISENNEDTDHMHR